MAQSDSKTKAFTSRDKLVLAGLYLSKFDMVGVRHLGFESFTEAFNVIGYALGSKPASIKNYRDEFDPQNSNQRKGWHKRPMRPYCREIFEKCNQLELEVFTKLLQSFLDTESDNEIFVSPGESELKAEERFAQRLMTGHAAEQYFEAFRATVPEFSGYEIENTTRFGCGYDFRLHPSGGSDFLAVEVKGLREKTGSILLTPKEHSVASRMLDRYFLFVVRNFRETPTHEVYRDPLSGILPFKRIERTIIQVSWVTPI